MNWALIVNIPINFMRIYNAQTNKDTPINENKLENFENYK